MGREPSRSRKLDVLEKRLAVLHRLVEAPAYKRDLVDEFDQSRSTINRAVDELESVDLVERCEEGFSATLAGRLALERLDSFQRDLDDLVEAEAVVGPLGVDAPVDGALVAGSEAVVADDPDPYDCLSGFHEALAEAEGYRAVVPALEDPRHVRLLYEHVVTRGRPAELVVGRELFGTLRSEYPRRLAAMAESDGFRIAVGDVTPFTLGIVEGRGTDRGEGPDRAVHVVVFTGDGTVNGTLVNRTDAGVRWAEDRFEAVRSRATDRTGAVLADADGGTATGPSAGGNRPGPLGQSLPVALEREGFVRLDAEYFREEPVADPTTAWRAGLTVPEVHAGYAVERTVTEEGEDPRSDGEPEGADEDPTLADALVADLIEGRDRVVVGPPGSGKSTVCKRVACEWYDADRGPVLYRESGRGGAFESVEDLVVTLDAVEGRALVVVEDAVRPEAAAVFEAREALGDRTDVSFLLDAREAEWADPPGDVPAAPDVEPLAMPGLDERDAARIVEAFERTAGESVGVPAAELLESVRTDRTEGAAGDGATPPGAVLLLLHRLATLADPLDEDRTSLEAAVAALYDDLAGEELALDVCVLASALNAAGVDVDPGALYAVASPAEFGAVDEAVARLEGRVLFPGPDDTYRTVHESWSVAFLERLLAAEGEALAAERFGDCVSALLSLADDPARRDRIARHRDGPAVTGLVDDPAAWAGETTEALYALARERPKLAPLFGDGEGDTVALPAACPGSLADRRPGWLGEAFLDAGRLDDAERAFERLPADGSRRDLERRIGLSRVATGRGEDDAAVERAEAAVSLAEDLGDRADRARAERCLGRALAEAEEYEAAEPHLRAALETFEALGERRAVAATLEALGEVSRERSAFEDAAAHHRRSLGIRRDLGDRRGEARSLERLGKVATKRNDLAAAHEHYERSLERYRRRGNRTGEMAVLAELGTVARLEGELGVASDYHRRSLAVAEAVGDRRHRAETLRQLATLAQTREDDDEAREFYERSLDLHEELGLTHGAAKVRSNAAKLAVIQGDYGTAREYLDRSDAVFEELGDPEGRALNAKTHGDLAREEGDLDAAAEHYRRGVELARSAGIPGAAAVARRELGKLQAERGETDAAREQLRAALAAFDEIGATGYALEVLRRLVETARQAGDEAAAGEWLGDARERLAEAPPPVVEKHEGWIERHREGTGDGG